jgi:hypothetical protein
MSNPVNIAWFITPHGFGHAARAAAIMLALSRRLSLHFHIYTQTPQWFFVESDLKNFTYHDCLCDVGLAQRTSLDEDLPETLRRLASLYPFSPHLISQLAGEVQTSGCRLVVCDIAPLGIAVAENAGIPSVLVENFTWDWIYSGYSSENGFSKYIPILKHWFSRASCHIQTNPVCLPTGTALTTAPVSRPFHQCRTDVRARLGLSPDDKTVLVTMGGIETRFDLLEQTQLLSRAILIIPGASSHPVRRGSAILLPHHSGFYHPDLLAACDAVIGKLGYSTLAEAYNAGVPYGFIPRARFPESPPLTQFIHENMPGILIPEQKYASGKWLDTIDALLELKTTGPHSTNGADQAADFIIQYFLR